MRLHNFGNVQLDQQIAPLHAVSNFDAYACARNRDFGVNRRLLERLDSARFFHYVMNRALDRMGHRHAGRIRQARLRSDRLLMTASRQGENRQGTARRHSTTEIPSRRIIASEFLGQPIFDQGQLILRSLGTVVGLNRKSSARVVGIEGGRLS